MSKLKQIREASGLSQSQLAERAELSVRTLQDLEQGRRDINGVKLLTLLQLCEALDCRLSDIVTDEKIIELLKTVSR
ncbi:MAG: helix-turn-helix transcriptional regulator [Lentihominibacter sp.]